MTILAGIAQAYSTTAPAVLRVHICINTSILSTIGFTVGAIYYIYTFSTHTSPITGIVTYSTMIRISLSINTLI